MSTPPDGARALFERFDQEGFSLIDRVVSEHWEENLLIDFKRIANDTPPLTKDGIKSLAEALSGFANSDGGVVVWGVDARSENPDEADVARELAPIANLKRFLSDLQHHTAQVVAPGIIGVEHKAFEMTPGTDTGFVVTFVPRSDGEPHMARGQKQHRYYFRSGDSFRPMEHFQIADRFGRRPQPKIEFYWRLAGGGSSSGPDGKKYRIQLIVGLKNSGRGLALYPGLKIRRTPQVSLSTYGLDGNGKLGLPQRATSGSSQWSFFAGGAHDVVYPNSTLEVTCASYEIWSTQKQVDDVTVEYLVLCDGDSKRGCETIPGAEFLDMLP